MEWYCQVEMVLLRGSLVGATCRECRDLLVSD